MTFKLNKLAALVGVGFGVLATSPAFAAIEGMGQAVRQLTNFGFYNAGTGNILNAGTDFTTFSALDNASTSASLNGTTIGQTGNSLPPSPPIDFAQKCLGACTFAENDYTHHSVPTTGTFSRSDMRLTGVVVAGVPLNGIVPPIGFEANPASSSLVAETQIQGGGSGNAQTTSGTGGSFRFTVANDGLQVLIDFNASDWLYAYVNPAVDAFASTSLSFTLRNITTNSTVFAWSPNGGGARALIQNGVNVGTALADPCSLNNTVSADFNIAGFEVSEACSGRFQARTNALVAGNLYQLSFAESTTAAATVVPEPGSLALVGLALAGLGFAGRRQQATKAA